MGQYFRIVNFTKKQVLNPLTFKNGQKIFEFALDSYGVMSALAFLLSTKLGDPVFQDEIIGSWIGDKIAVLGDYQKEYDKAGDYEDISQLMINLLMKDEDFAEQFTIKK